MHASLPLGLDAAIRPSGPAIIQFRAYSADNGGYIGPSVSTGIRASRHPCTAFMGDYSVAGWKQKLTETARRNRVELVDARLSRRDLFKLGLLSSSGFLVTKLGLSSRAAGAGAVASPPTTPWLEELPVPPVATPCAIEDLGAFPTRECNVASGEAGRAVPHQHWDRFDPGNVDCHLLENRPAQMSWHRELPPDDMWLFNGVFPGPRIHARYGRPVMLRIGNQLPDMAEHRGYGRPTPTTHLHGAHTESDSAGCPLDMLPTGSWKDHFFLNARAGFSEPRFEPQGDLGATLSTLWYHDHCLDFTAQNIYRGNAGVYYLFNEFDTGDENDPSPTAWRLPSGAFDVPLVFHDRAFDATGKGYFDLFSLDGLVGDKVTVNGRIQPFMHVARRKYRFRAQNIGVSRCYNLVLSSGQEMRQITHDGSYLPQPRSVKNLRLAVSQRADVVLDFSALPSGTEVYLVNLQVQHDGRGPTDKLLPVPLGMKLLKFIVDGTLDTGGDPSRVPDWLISAPPVDPAEVAADRTFVLDRTNGGWSVNRKPFDASAIMARPRQGTAEIWNLVNNSSDRTHPAYIHIGQHQILTRNGVALPAGEVSRGDSVWLAPGENVQVFRRFRDFTGRYAAYCQNVVDGDHAMMFMWEIVA